MKTLRLLQPMFVLIALAVGLIVVTTIVRAVSAGAGFLVERQVVLLVWLAGLLIAGAVFGWVARRSLRRDGSALTGSPRRGSRSCSLFRSSREPGCTRASPSFAAACRAVWPAPSSGASSPLGSAGTW